MLYYCEFQKMCFNKATVILILLLNLINIQRSICSESSEEIEKSSRIPELLPWNDIRLPKFIVPIYYNLSLQPDLETLTNLGSVKITFQVKMASNFIVIHAKGFKSLNVFLYDDNEIIAPMTSYNSRLEQLYIQFPKALEPYKCYILAIEFARDIDDSMEGFYVSTVRNKNGDKRLIGTTQFESTYARQAFPCFDEPALKAIFQLTVVHKKDLVVYFNTDAESIRSYSNDLKISTFSPTVQMSTYLVAFVISDFKYVEITTINDIILRVVLPEEKLHKTSISMNVANQTMHFLTNYFKIKYPMKKLDQIGIPDFRALAMENWGLVTYRMSALALDPQNVSPEEELKNADVIAHELAHQWFGNLVTMKWWDDLWLNEGFATYMSNVVMSFIRPEWNVMELFGISVSQRALGLDSLQNSHPIIGTVKDPNEIESMFDAITYSKGAAIIYMLETFMGTENLRSGLTEYLKKYAYSNANTEDLWNSLSQVSVNLNVSAVMHSWTNQMGYPVLIVTRDEKNVFFNQSRFVILQSQEYGNKNNYQNWHILVSYIINDSSSIASVWLSETYGYFTLSSSSDWFKINVKQTGFYRVMYDRKSWDQLTYLLRTNHKILSSIDRANLLNDAFALSRASLLESSVPLNMSLYLMNEIDYSPWIVTLSEFDFIFSMLEETDKISLIQIYAVKLIQPIKQNLSWDDEGSLLNRKLRTSVLQSAFRYGDQDVIKIGKELFNHWMINNSSIPQHLKYIAFHSGIKFGSFMEWNYCWEKVQETEANKQVILHALAQTSIPELLSQYLNYTLQRDILRLQDVSTVIVSIAQNPLGKNLVWQFVHNNWGKLVDLYREVMPLIKYIVSPVISTFNTQLQYDQALLFLQNVNVTMSFLSLKQSLEKIQIHIQWKEKVQNDVIEWLQSNPLHI